MAPLDDLSELLDQQVQRDMSALRERVTHMGTLVTEALGEAVRALVERDRKLGFRVVLADQTIDALEGHIDRLCQEFMIRHLPVAAQLRFVVSVIKINSELERVGDYAESVARRAVDLATLPPHPSYPHMQQMAEISIRMLRQALEAFAEENAELASETLDLDREVNAAERAIHDQVYSEQLRLDAESLHTLLTVADRFERVADRACNICEDVVYMCTGEVVRHLSREDQQVLFLSLHNGFRTQVAESIGRSLAPANLHFRSAGLNPRPLAELGLQVAARLGVDLSRQRPKPVDDAGKLDQFHLIVTFGREAEEVIARLPYKVIWLDWEILAPVGEPLEGWYAEIVDELRSKVADLVLALTGPARVGKEDG